MNACSPSGATAGSESLNTAPPARSVAGEDLPPCAGGF